MSLDRIIRRTAQRRAAGVSQDYPEHGPAPNGIRSPAADITRNPGKGPRRESCVHLLGRAGQDDECDEGCAAGTRIPLQLCRVHGRCTVAVRGKAGHQCCRDCADYRTDSLPLSPVFATLPDPSPPVQPVKRKFRPTQWSYGVTTVPSRRGNVFPRTLDSLRKAGFDAPRLFVDGDADGASWEREFGVPVTARGGPPTRTAANWCLALAELYGREPNADRYAVFQDDLLTVQGLREYLEKTPWPTGAGKGGAAYLNLYTFPENTPTELRGLKASKRGTGYPSDAEIPTDPKFRGWYPSNQLGRGAVALVFDRTAVVALLSSRYLVERPQDPSRGHRAIDGGIVEALRSKSVVAAVGSAVREYVHAPSLTMHTGAESSMGNKPHRQAVGFPGEEFDAREWLKM